LRKFLHHGNRLQAIAIAVITILHFLPAAAWAQPRELPDPARTPGVTYPGLTEESFRERFCADANGHKRHRTSEERPDTSYTSGLKREQLAEWSYDDQNPRDYEEDHLISLELGGDPADPKNLWPEPYAGEWGARTKDTLEGELGRRVCLAPGDDDYVPLAEAQHAIASDWISAYRAYVCNRSLPLTKKMREHCP
jgi:hypothetical protein